MAPKFVIPYRKNAKNDAEAIRESFTRPKTRFVNVKSEEQRVAWCRHIR